MKKPLNINFNIDDSITISKELIRIDSNSLSNLSFNLFMYVPKNLIIIIKKLLSRLEEILNSVSHFINKKRYLKSEENISLIIKELKENNIEVTKEDILAADILKEHSDQLIQNENNKNIPIRIYAINFFIRTTDSEIIVIRQQRHDTRGYYINKQNTPYKDNTELITGADSTELHLKKDYARKIHIKC